MAVLSKADRDALPDSDFALSGRRYPIHDRVHAQEALEDSAKENSGLTAKEKRTVRAMVAMRYPDMKVTGAK